MSLPQIDDDDAVPISPPFWCSATNKYAVRVEHRSEEYVLRWTHPPRQPSLSGFPNLAPGVESQKIEHSEKEAEVWASSRLCNFGSYSHIRKSNTCEGPFPMYKIAHRTAVAQSLVCNEFHILQELGPLSLPIVQISDTPIIDEFGILGFAMEKLSPINPKDVASYDKDIENAFDDLHQRGYVHMDVSLSNLMLTEERAVRLIDFGQAGKIGEALPEHHPSRRLGMQIYEQDMDDIGLERIRNRFCSS